MKLSPILIAATLAFGGTAMAQSQSHDTYKRSDDDRAATTRKADEPSTAHKTKEGAKTMGEKTKEGAEHVGEATKRGAKRAAAATGSAAHRGAEAMRHAGQAIERKLPHTQGSTQSAKSGSSGETGTPGASTTTAMGAGPAGADMSGDHDRRQRMDDAYANWQRKQGQR